MLWDVYAGIATLPERSDSYWIAPTGEVAVSDLRHINDVINNPESFGISADYVKKMYRKHGERLYQEGEAREVIIMALMKKGWLRLRNIISGRNGQGWIIQCWQLNATVKDNVWSWAVAMLKNEYATKHQDIFLHAVSDNEEVRGTFGEFASGKVLYASERGQDSDYDKDRQQYFKNEPDETPGLSPLDFNQPWQTDNFQVPVDVDKKDKEQVDWEGRENLQLWTSLRFADKKFEDEIFIALMLPESARDKYKHIRGLDDDLHMTLLFVKEKPTDEQKEKIKKAVAKVAKDFEPFKCELTGIASFDNDTQTMAALVNILDGAALHAALLKAVEGAYHELDDREYGYLPHVTLRMEGPKNVSLDKLEPYEWTAEELMLKFSDDEAYSIALGSGDIHEQLEATAAPESYTTESDVKQDKRQFDERALEMRQEDHTEIDNQRDWPFQDPDYKNLRLIPIKLDDQAQNKQQKPQLAHGSLKMGWDIGVGYDKGDYVMFYDANGSLVEGTVEAVIPEKKNVPVLIRHGDGYAEWVPASAIVSLMTKAALDDVDFDTAEVAIDPHIVMVLSEWGGKPFAYFGSSKKLLVGHSGEIHEDLLPRMMEHFKTYPGIPDDPDLQERFEGYAARIINEERAYYGRLMDDGSLVSFWIPEQKPDFDQKLTDCLFELVRGGFLRRNGLVNFAGEPRSMATPVKGLMARSSVELPGGESYSEYDGSTEPRPDETLQHGPTTRHEKWDQVKYRHYQIPEEKYFEVGLHEPLRKEVDRPVTPYGTLDAFRNVQADFLWALDDLVYTGSEIFQRGEKGDVYRVGTSKNPGARFCILESKIPQGLIFYFGDTVKSAFLHLVERSPFHAATLKPGEAGIDQLEFAYVTHVNAEDFDFYIGLAQTGAPSGIHPRTGFVVYAQEELEVDYPTYDEIVQINREAVDKFGGMHATYPHTRAAIEAAIGRPQAGFGGYAKYATLPEKAAALAHSLATHHTFPDGNKRTAYSTATTFLHRNGWALKDEGEGLVDLILKISVGEDKTRETRDAEEQELIQYFLTNAVPYEVPEEDYEDEV